MEMPTEAKKLDERSDVEIKLAKLIAQITNSCPEEDYNYEPWDCENACGDLMYDEIWRCWLKYAIDCCNASKPTTSQK